MDLDRQGLTAPGAGHLEFCGGIGIDKSTYAALLAERWSVRLVTERFEDVRYWSESYREPAVFSLEKDLGFLLSHAEVMRAVAEPLVCDFAMFQTVAYSQIAGSAADTEAIEAVFQRMAQRVGHPAVVVARLRCETDVQLGRIIVRGRRPEQGITEDSPPAGRGDRQAESSAADPHPP